MAVTLKSLVRLGNGDVVTVADGLASGALVRTRYWDIQIDHNRSAILRHGSDWRFECGSCPQHRTLDAARARLAVFKGEKGMRIVSRDFIDSPDGSTYGQIGKTTACEEGVQA